MKDKITQVGLVENYLLRNNTITTWEAYERFGITRLSGIIYKLRQCYEIESVNTTKVNRYGNTVNFSTYTLKGVKNGFSK